MNSIPLRLSNLITLSSDGSFFFTAFFTAQSTSHQKHLLVLNLFYTLFNIQKSIGFHLVFHSILYFTKLTVQYSMYIFPYRASRIWLLMEMKQSIFLYCFNRLINIIKCYLRRILYNLYTSGSSDYIYKSGFL